MHKTHLAAFLTAAMFLGLSACGGGGEETPPSPAPPPAPAPAPPPPGTIVGAAGGTVTGPNGASVVIPAGALTNDTRINIALSSPGTPALPGAFTSQGQMYAFTPHGTTFAVPVTVTLPHDPAQVPAHRFPRLYKTNAQNQWTEVVDATFTGTSVSGQVTSFSEFVNGFLRHDPVRNWEFSINLGDGGPDRPIAGSPHSADTGELVHDFEVFGPLPIDGAIPGSPAILLHDELANGFVLSTPNGVTYEVVAEAPSGLFLHPGAAQAVEGVTKFTQRQSYEKRSAAAHLEYTITRIEIATADLNPAPLELGRQIEGAVLLTVRAFKNTTPTVEFYSASGLALVTGFRGDWVPHSDYDSGYREVLWNDASFDFTENHDFGVTPPGGLGVCSGSHATLTLKEPITHSVPVDQLLLNEEFTFVVEAVADTINPRSGGGFLFDCQGGYASAVLRDPAGEQGTAIRFSGLAPTHRPVLGPRVPPLVEPAACLPGPGPDPAAGSLQFSAANYTIDERGRIPVIRVTRSGGGRGAVTATFEASDGSAIAGTDYTSLRSSVFFADGEEGSRLVTLPIVQDDVAGEPDKTVNLALSQPGGCAALGSQTTAVLTITDDDIPPPAASFTVGGTVSGLVGPGSTVTLQDHRFESLTTGNGAFTFSLPTQSGQPYSVIVLTQPSNQVCTVANGSGTMGNANVTNVEVTCAAPPTAPGGLDPAFGGGTGIVSTAFGGDETHMLLLPDGKILMVGGSSVDFVMARYEPDGDLDPSFSEDGRVTTDIAGGADAAFGAALLSDGDIIVVGTARVGNNDDFAFVRYDADGRVDTQFGTQGKTTTDFFGARDRAYAVAVFPDGSIVVAGETLLAVGGGTDFAIARYTPAGVLDTSFGGAGTGKANTDIAAGVDSARNVVITSTGSILASGYITMGSSPLLDHAAVVRYTAAGAVEGGFAAAGKRVMPNMALGDGLALQSDGRILVAGHIVEGSERLFGVMRLEDSGAIDASFGALGLATAAFTGDHDFGRDVAVDAQGRILVSGQSSNLVPAAADFAVARFTPGGTLDGTFFDDGKFTVDFFDAGDSAENVAVQPDGRIVLGGFAVNGTSVRYGLARINP